MIITKQWLNEWIEIEDISTKKLCEVLNSIGLEVDSVKEYKMPQNVVVGYVEQKIPHPNADKLSVCSVNVKDEICTIVCGAKNVEQGQYVAVALQGAKLPNGLSIKKAKLRGVESNGMICSSSELGLPRINDGIMVLDKSVGEFQIGQNLSEIASLNDDVIEIELTANRGDCLSIHGVCRDLSVALKKDIKDIQALKDDENLLGIGRVLSLHVDDKIDASFIYKVIQYSNIEQNLLLDLRLALVDLPNNDPLERIINYVTYSTGVLLRAYDCNCQDEKSLLHVKLDENGFVCVYVNDELVSKTGYIQHAKRDLQTQMKQVILEASYIEPELISKLGMQNKDKASDFHYYRSSRGSEPDLEFGIKYLDKMLKNEKNIKPYGGCQKAIKEKELKTVNFELNKAISIIGDEIPKNQSVQILKGLGFDVLFKAEQDMMSVKIPAYRHDVSDMQDVCEEIVRIIGIDNIPSKPYIYAEKLRINKAYENYKTRSFLRAKSISVGFFESVHYVFDSKEKMQKYGINTINEQKELLNPITYELNSLRQTLVLHLIQAASLNAKNSYKSIKLFEIGQVFDENRTQNTNIAWVFSGEKQSACIQNNATAKMIDFEDFTKQIVKIVGEIKLKQAKPTNKLYSPYEYAHVLINGEIAGFIGRMHVNVEEEYGILNTYVCELKFDKLKPKHLVAKPYSKFPLSSRDLSLLVPKDMPYQSIKECIEKNKMKNLVKFYPINRFESDELKDKVSLSLRFVFQDENTTLEDEQVSAYVEQILQILQENLQVSLR